MTTTTITGASDDNLEIDGAITEEFYVPKGAATIATSAGHLLRFRFENEGWRATRVVNRADCTITPDDAGDDVVTIDGELHWVLVTKDEPVLAR